MDGEIVNDTESEPIVEWEVDETVADASLPTDEAVVDEEPVDDTASEPVARTMSFMSVKSRKKKLSTTNRNRQTKPLLTEKL